MSYERKLLLYIDVKTNEIFVPSDDGAVLLGATVPAIQFGELVRATVQLTDGTPAFGSGGTLSNPYTDLAGSAATSEIVVDNNFNWYDPARLSADVPAEAAATLTLTSVNFTPRQYGAIRLGASDIVHYCAWTAYENSYTFTLADSSFAPASFTPSQAYTAGAPVRLIEQPVIVSAQNAATPATGLFDHLLDAGNPVYEELVEGKTGISGTMLEFSIYVGGRVVFRLRTLFDCLGAIDPGTGFDWIRSSVWDQADSRYLQLSNLSATATTVASGDPATVTVNRTGQAVSLDFEIPEGTPAGFGTPTASASAVAFSAAPTASVSSSGPDTAKVFAFEFGIPAGAPAGTVHAFAGDAANIPTGYLLCNGAAISRTTYTTLFAAIGTIYGAGNHITTSSPPHCRGKFLRGYKSGTTAEIGTAQGDASRNITGSVGFIQSVHQEGSTDFNSATSALYATVSLQNKPAYSSSNTARDVINIGLDASRNTGFPTAGENRPANYAVNYIIKY